jgi:hypothetical protein
MAWHRIVPMKKIRFPTGHVLWVRRPTQEIIKHVTLRALAHPVGATIYLASSAAVGYYGGRALGRAIVRHVEKKQVEHAVRMQAALKAAGVRTPRKLSQPSRVKYHPSRYRPGGGYNPNEPRDYHGRWTR